MCAISALCVYVPSMCILGGALLLLLLQSLRPCAFYEHMPNVLTHKALENLNGRNIRHFTASLIGISASSSSLFLGK